MSLNGSKIKILIANSHSMMRYGIKRVIEDHTDNLQVIEAADADEILDAINEHPDFTVFIIAYDLSDRPGMEMLAELKKRCPRIPVILTAGTEDPAVIKSAIDNGAAGFILKNTPPHIIIQALNLVLAGGSYIPKSLLELDDQCLPSPDSLKPALTYRQLEILNLIATGFTDKEIASILAVSRHTVKSHTTCLRNLLGAKNRTMAVEYARKLGFIK